MKVELLPRTQRIPGRRLFLASAIVALASCGSGPKTTVAPIEPARDTACSLDGMLLADYPGPKAQIHYEQGPPDFFCDTIEMFSLYLRPEQQRRVRALFVQDMANADWDHPRGRWIDATAAFYLAGSDLRGSMGPTFASFSRVDDAKAFATRHGGHVLRFGEVKPDMATLDGGVIRDRIM